MSDPKTEFSRPFQVDRLHGAAIMESIKANEAERAALAKRFGLSGIGRLEAGLTISPPNVAELIAVEGTLRATVTQTCILTAEDFDIEVEAEVKSLFGTALAGYESDPESAAESEWDAPDAIEHGIIDLGELVAQQLVVNLDPYPRKPGAEWREPEPDGEISKVSPFAVLQKLKQT
jgi:uncharacterized metal-binding protein YceD (DUF177 family)